MSIKCWWNWLKEKERIARKGEETDDDDVKFWGGVTVYVCGVCIREREWEKKKEEREKIGEINRGRYREIGREKRCKVKRCKVKRLKVECYKVERLKVERLKVKRYKVERY